MALRIVIPPGEVYDEKNNIIMQTKFRVLFFEFSLRAVSRWESKWKKPFLIQENFSPQEVDDMLYFMCLDEEVDPILIQFLTSEQREQLVNRISDKCTATWFSEIPGQKQKTINKHQIITAELVYYWMFSYNIDMSFETRNLHQLLTLIDVFNRKNNSKKMSKSEIYARNKAINAANRKRFNSKG